MIKVELMDKDLLIMKTIGEFKPNEVNQVIELFQVYGAVYDNEKYYFKESYYDADINRFVIIVTK